MKYVKVSAKVERRIENLRQSGKEGNVIEQKVKSSSNADTANFCGDEVPMNLSDQDLRRVFCGLVEGAKKRPR